MRCGGARSRLRRKRTPNEASHWPHTRRLRSAFFVQKSEPSVADQMSCCGCSCRLLPCRSAWHT